MGLDNGLVADLDQNTGDAPSDPLGASAEAGRAVSRQQCWGEELARPLGPETEMASRRTRRSIGCIRSPRDSTGTLLQIRPSLRFRDAARGESGSRSLSGVPEPRV